MIARLIDVALERRLLCVVLGAALALGGVYAALGLKLEAYPDISDPFVVVVTTYPGYATEEVEQQITVPIERALNGVPGVISRRSRTIFGLSVVELTFDEGTDDFRNRQLVLEYLQAAELPPDAAPELGPPSTGISEFYRYVLVSGRHDEMFLRELQDWVVGPRLMQVPGVAEVVTFGGLVKQHQVEIDPLALERYGLGIADIAAAIEANNRNAGGALLQAGQQELPIRGVGLIRSSEDIERIVVGSTRGVPTFLSDLATVRIGAAPQTGIFGLDDRTGGVQGIVLMRRGENPSEVLRHIHAAVDDVRARYLPEGVSLVTIHDRTDLVQNTLRTVGTTLVEGLLVVATVLFLFLFSVRAALLAGLVVPLSLLFAFAAMRLAGIPASLLSLGALDFGIIVDGAVVMIDHILHRLGLLGPGASRVQVRETVRQAARTIARPVFFSMVIIISAFLPLLTLERVERRLFTPMAFTICFALLGALILSLTLVPALASYLYRDGSRRRVSPLVSWVQSYYGGVLDWLIGRARTVTMAAAGVVAGAAALASTLGTEFLPQLDEGVIWVRANLPPGISLDASAAVAADVRRLVRETPEVRLVASQTGRNEAGTDPFGSNRNEFLIELHPYHTWERGRTKDQVVAELDGRLRAAVPGADFNFTQPIIDTSTEIATGSSADLAVLISGPDRAVLRRLAEDTLAMLRTVPGAADTSIEQEADQPQLRIDIDRESVARYGLNVADVQDVVDLAIGGRPVSVVYEDDRRFDITARFVSDARADPDSIADLRLPTPTGGRVPLALLADVALVEGATVIARAENERQLSVRTNIRGRDQGGFAAEAQRRFPDEVTLPPGYSVEWGGQFQNLQRARARMLVVIPLTVLIIFGLLFVTFRNARDAALVLVCLPFAAVGGIVALWLRDINLSVSAFVGFVSLFGVTAMAGVLLVTEICRQREVHGLVHEEAVRAGARACLRPILMMILVALFGIVPAALASGIGSDIQRPLATVLLGGLGSALVLTLLALPAIYALFGRPAGVPLEPYAVDAEGEARGRPPASP